MRTTAREPTLTLKWTRQWSDYVLLGLQAVNLGPSHTGRRFETRRQVLAPRVSADRTTYTCCQRLHSQPNNTHTAVQHALFHIWQLTARREGKSSDGVNQWVFRWRRSFEGFVVILLLALLLQYWRVKEKDHKWGAVWRWMSLKVLSSPTSTVFDAWIWGRSSSHCSCSDLLIPGVRRQK